MGVRATARRFGGFFGTIKTDGGAVAEFFDRGGALIAAMPIACPVAGQWKWDGWQSAGEGFSRIRISGVGPDAGRVMHDDLELDFEGCYADCDRSGSLAMTDFSCFQSRYLLADPYANCTHDEILTIADFACFQRAFVQGCP